MKTKKKNSFHVKIGLALLVGVLIGLAEYFAPQDGKATFLREQEQRMIENRLRFAALPNCHFKCWGMGLYFEDDPYTRGQRNARALSEIWAANGPEAGGLWEWACSSMIASKHLLTSVDTNRTLYARENAPEIGAFRGGAKNFGVAWKVPGNVSLTLFGEPVNVLNINSDGIIYIGRADYFTSRELPVAGDYRFYAPFWVRSRCAARASGGA